MRKDVCQRRTEKERKVDGDGAGRREAHKGAVEAEKKSTSKVV